MYVEGKGEPWADWKGRGPYVSCKWRGLGASGSAGCTALGRGVVHGSGGCTDGRGAGTAVACLDGTGLLGTREGREACGVGAGEERSVSEGGGRWMGQWERALQVIVAGQGAPCKKG